jgi:general secretion pathway protein N
MKRWTMIAIGLGIYALVLLLTAPATLVDAGLQRASDGRLRLAEARGSVWSGSGQIEVREANGRTGVARFLSWRFVPGSLLRGHLVCEVALDRADRTFPVTLSFSRVELADAEISLPAAVLGLAVPKLKPLGLTGDVMINVARLSMASDGVRGNATINWRTAGSRLSPVSPLGDYEVRLDAEGKVVHVYLRTIEGPMRLDGKGSWTRGNAPEIQAMASVPPQYQKELAPLLHLIAVQRAPGQFELQIN